MDKIKIIIKLSRSTHEIMKAIYSCDEELNCKWHRTVQVPEHTYKTFPAGSFCLCITIIKCFPQLCHDMPQRLPLNSRSLNIKHFLLQYHLLVFFRSSSSTTKYIYKVMYTVAPFCLWILIIKCFPHLSHIPE